MVDADGNPIEPEPSGAGKIGPDEALPPEEEEPAEERLDPDWLDRSIDRRRPRPADRPPPARHDDSFAL
jgi:hypothetical protein